MLIRKMVIDLISLQQSSIQPSMFPSELRVKNNINISFNFNYVSPQHIHNIPSIQSTTGRNIQHLTFTNQNNRIEHNFLTKLDSVQEELDTTIDTYSDAPLPEHTTPIHRKPLCQSVIVTAVTNSPFQPLDLNNHILDLNSPKKDRPQVNPMKRSCMPALISQNNQENRFYSPTDKENYQFVKYAKEQNNKFLSFSKNKFKPKKITQKQLKIQEFQVGEMLGKGSIGRVYLAKHRATNFYYALKKIIKSQIKDISQFCFGVKCHFFLNDPHLAQLYACFHDEQHIYLLMELCIDGNLAKYNKNIKTDEDRNKIILGTAKGLQYMHSYLLRHGDLKLENILISFGFPKLTDFDCVFKGPTPTFHQIQRKNQLWGSPAYFSPGMIKQSTFSLSDDIWSLGVITYEVYSRSHPFNLHGSEDLAKIVENELIPLPLTLNETTKKIIQKMLNKSENKRASLEQIVAYCLTPIE